MHKLFFFVLLSVAAFSSLSAQRYGHLNFANLLSQMPGTATAEAELKAYSDQMTAEGEAMVTELRNKVTELEVRVQDMSPKELQTERAVLNQEREKIVRYEQQMGVSIEKKRQELLGPLITQARNAVDRVAKANEYQLIFDTSQFNTILFGQDSDDIMPLVKTELGM